jgi:hypothetical protein
MSRFTNPIRALAMSIALVCAAAAPTKAQAGCCDDFWSCAGAVASYGASCIIDEVNRKVGELRREAQEALTHGQQSITDASSLFNDRVSQAKQQAFGARDDLQQLFEAHKRLTATIQFRPNISANMTPATAAATSTGASVVSGALGVAGSSAPAPNAGTKVAAPNAINLPSAATTKVNPATVVQSTGVTMHLMPPDENELRAAIKRAEDYISSMQQQSQSKYLATISKVSNELEQMLVNDLRSVSDLMQRSVIGPLQGTLKSLERYDPTGLISLINNLISSVDAVVSVLDSQVLPAITALDDALQTKVDALAEPTNTLLGYADVMRAINPVLERLSKAPTKGDLEKLNKMLPPEPKTPIQLASMRSLAQLSSPTKVYSVKVTRLGFKPSHDKSKASIVKLASSLKSPSTQAAFQSKLSTSELSLYKNRADEALNKEFAGLTPSQRTGKQQALLSEAQRRFSSDPKALQEVEKLIKTAASAGPPAPTFGTNISQAVKDPVKIPPPTMTLPPKK